jgi:hypothetical protein
MTNGVNAPMLYGNRVPLAFMLAVSAATSVGAKISPPQAAGPLQLGSLKALLDQSGTSRATTQQPATAEDGAGVQVAQYWLNNPCFSGYWRRC